MRVSSQTHLDTSQPFAPSLLVHLQDPFPALTPPPAVPPSPAAAAASSSLSLYAPGGERVYQAKSAGELRREVSAHAPREPLQTSVGHSLQLVVCRRRRR